MSISYKAGYKYQLVAVYSIQTLIRPKEMASNDYVCIYPNGLLTISKGYAWDGPSGPCPDVPSAMRGSLVHDALYQLIRVCGLWDGFRSFADDLLRELCIQDGMPIICADAIYEGVHLFGSRYTDASAESQIITVGVN